jgi:hypothetical protein
MRTSRATLLALLLTCGLAALFTAGAGASSDSPLTGQWNRLSVDRSHAAPEHELLSCVESNGAKAGTSSDGWFCRYSKRPEPSLGLSWNNNYGLLSGHDVTATWICPAWFPDGICSNVVGVVEGTMVFFDPSAHQAPFSVLEDLVVVRTPSGDRLYNYWVNQFVCPWFRTFSEALAANPISLPFDGNFPPQDCVAAH